MEADQSHLIGRGQYPGHAPSPRVAPVAPFGHQQRHPFEGVVSDLTEHQGGVSVSEVSRPSPQEQIQLFHDVFGRQQHPGPGGDRPYLVPRVLRESAGVTLNSTNHWFIATGKPAPPCRHPRPNRQTIPQAGPRSNGSSPGASKSLGSRTHSTMSRNDGNDPRRSLIGKWIAQIARDLDTNPGTLSNWVARERAEESVRPRVDLILVLHAKLCLA
jgi:hypothetical protein